MWLAVIFVIFYLLIIIGTFFFVKSLFLPRKSISKIVDETVENYLDSWKFQEIMAAITYDETVKQLKEKGRIPSLSKEQFLKNIKKEWEILNGKTNTL